MCSRRRSGPLIRGALLILAVAATIAVDGCAVGRPPHPVPAQHPAVAQRPATATAQAQARFVLATDANALRWSWVVGRAQEQLTSACMRGLGFVYLVPDPGPEPSTRSVTANALGSGLPATYGMAAQTAQPQNPGNDQPRYQLALKGSPSTTESIKLPDGSTISYQTGGCYGRTQTRLFGSIRAAMVSGSLPQTIRAEFDGHLSADQPYTAALRVWRACMAGRGWDFASPDAAIQTVQTVALGQTELDRRQTAIADADTTCDEQSQLRARRGEALARFVLALAPDLTNQLADVYAARAHAGRVAQQILTQ